MKNSHKRVVRPQGYSSSRYWLSTKCPSCSGLKSWFAKQCKKCQILKGKPRQDNNVYTIERVRCRKISLTQGKYTTVNKSDFARLSKLMWSYGSNGYPQTNIGRHGAKTIILMHWLIRGKNYDHKNGDKLDNRRKNLRPCTKSQNAANSCLNRNNTSGYKGVSKDHRMRKGTRRWRSKIMVNGKVIGLGSFYTAEEAARAYDKGARKHFGKFARLNLT